MNKLIFSIIALMAVMTVQAQSICGSWQSMKPAVIDNEDGNGMLSYVYTFNEDGTFVTDLDVTYSDKNEQKKEREFVLTGNMKGTYTLKGDKLTMYFNVNTLNLEVSRVSQNGVQLELPAGMIPTVNEKLNNAARAKAANAFPDTHYTVKLDSKGSMLELNDTKSGKTERLMRVKK